ncbi:hypothetical protein ACIRST_41505 [Kitasatospora sp. NPDC101447]|uniref:hypothetical protein n=1 Tax=Kitasatospora sp. NPDC101447 TaxID=3364102 RepID=UPI0037F564F6
MKTIASDIGRAGSVRRKLGRRAGSAAVAMALAGAGLITGTGQAHASGTWINGWSTVSTPFRCTVGSDESTDFCLYYNSGAEGAIWVSQSGKVYSVWDYHFRNDGYGSNGAGAAVWHDAASVEAAVGGCAVGVYSGTSFTGDANYVPSGRGGNLTSTVKNKEESIGVAC